MQNNSRRFPTMAYDLVDHELLSRFTVPVMNSLLWSGLKSSQKAADYLHIVMPLLLQWLWWQAGFVVLRFSLLLASCVLLQNQNLSCTAVGKASWAVSSDWKSGIWPGKGLCSLEIICLPTVSLHFHSRLPWIGEKFLLASS